MSRAAVVYVHGLWHQGPESWLLARRLAADFDFQGYHYASVTTPMAEVCAGLRAFVARIDAPVVHFIGHSLGGIIIHRYLGESAPPQPGRVVLLGAPMGGSAVAVAAAPHGWIRRLMGRGVEEELLAPRARRWTDARPLGLIAGTFGVGLAPLFTRFDEPNDGVVALSETRVPGASGHITVHATHFGLLLSVPAARQASAFLREGKFEAL